MAPPPAATPVPAERPAAGAAFGDPAAPDAFGVYVHVPFCARRCDYCDFATWVDRSSLMADYAAACRTELAGAALPPATSVFFGGGTPSLLPGELFASILQAVPLAPGAEVSVECNPDTVSAELFGAYRRAGVTRVSFGVQSMVASVLASLGRTHDPDNVVRAVALARESGFSSFNLDLIYGAAGETLSDWARTLDSALALEPPHVSAYALTVEPGTPLAADPARHPDDDDQADKYVLAEAVLTGAGLANYEVSNWARPGHECRHNLLYWSQGDYRGVGCAAHSHAAGRRSWNVRSVDRYLERVRAGRPPEVGAEVLDPEARRLEGLQLALRTRAGVPASALSPTDLERLGGLVVPAGPHRLALSVEGRLLANEVTTCLRV